MDLFKEKRERKKAVSFHLNPFCIHCVQSEDNMQHASIDCVVWFKHEPKM